MSTELFAEPRTEVQPVVFPALRAPGESEGFTRGHAAGYAAGLRRAEAEARARRAEHDAELATILAAGRERVERAVTVLDTAADALAQRVAPVLSEAEAQLAAAAVALAEAVLGRELSDAPRAARAALERALSAPDAASVLRVRLHPDDLALLEGLREGAPDAGTSPGAPPAVVLVADPTLARGDAVAVYPDGELDARIGTALARAAEALAEECA
ncbi:FliH/SctL family protein [Sinomonas sp. JGH33]|uniref:FliH/SctL family protein n=1 Tax=Sinomonas terricola TaxID=3110330 RepID=A0ABU5TBS4_9MICC|nr:FliH/SctL family protein [Sinomonas sp. JGH33]MEA5457147.1 FliH/SctL family protein [Sinomonas sp. JGH33]